MATIADFKELGRIRPNCGFKEAPAVALYKHEKTGEYYLTFQGWDCAVSLEQGLPFHIRDDDQHPKIRRVHLRIVPSQQKEP